MNHCCHYQHFMVQGCHSIAVKMETYILLVMIKEKVTVV